MPINIVIAKPIIAIYITSAFTLKNNLIIIEVMKIKKKENVRVEFIFHSLFESVYVETMKMNIKNKFANQPPVTSLQ
jgi:hypothetical protein